MALPDHIKDPAEIYRQSFATVEREVSLDALPESMRSVATRLVHSCGMVDLVDDLRFSNAAVKKGVAALKAGCEIYCDVEMVKSGIIQRNLPIGAKPVCTLNLETVNEHALKIENTRSAASVDFWDNLQGSICVIGNAPTALFRLLERIETENVVPALIIGIPVGFIGAAESKQELSINPRGSEFITVLGRRGGSAMACAALNAISILAAK